MAGLVLLGLLVAALLAPRYGTDSRPEFSGHPDWRNHTA
jgi:hypothetical protein